jgi:hypothetical protein
MCIACQQLLANAGNNLRGRSSTAEERIQQLGHATNAAALQGTTLESVGRLEALARLERLTQLFQSQSKQLAAVWKKLGHSSTRLRLLIECKRNVATSQTELSRLLERATTAGWCWESCACAKGGLLVHTYLQQD